MKSAEPVSPVAMKMTPKLEVDIKNVTASICSSRDELLELDDIGLPVINSRKKSPMFKVNHLTELQIFSSGAPIHHNNKRKQR